MSDLISRKDAIEYLMINMNWMDEDGYQIHDAEQKRGIITDLIFGVPSASSWSVVRAALNELKQKEEKLYADYCDTTARLKAINKIAESDQTPNRKIDGIKPLAEMEVGE